MKKFTTKDSGARSEYASGMVRDTQEGKARFDLLLPLGVPYADQPLTRIADLMSRGQKKYGSRNWELGEGQEELDRAKSSAFRHFMQWITGEEDEDHFSGCVFNMIQVEVLLWRLTNEKNTRDSTT